MQRSNICNTNKYSICVRTEWNGKWTAVETLNVNFSHSANQKGRKKKRKSAFNPKVERKQMGKKRINMSLDSHSVYAYTYTTVVKHTHTQLKNGKYTRKRNHPIVQSYIMVIGMDGGDTSVKNWLTQSLDFIASSFYLRLNQMATCIRILLLFFVVKLIIHRYPNQSTILTVNKPSERPPVFDKQTIPFDRIETNEGNIELQQFFNRHSTFEN